MEPNPSRTELRRLCLALAELSAAAPTETGLPGSQPSLSRLGRRIGSIAYLRALTDMLRLLNLVELKPDSDTIEIPSVTAGYCLRVLYALAQEGVLVPALPLESDTISPVALPARTTNLPLLAALEQYRIAVCRDPQPLREVHAAVGLIGMRLASGQPALLFHWDAAAGMWQLPGGRYEARDGDFRQTLVRELSEELACGPLRDGIDVVIHDIVPPFTNVWLSPTFGILSRTTFHLYRVSFSDVVLTASNENRWITEPEITTEKTSDGQNIDAFPVKHVLNSLNTSLAALVEQ